MTDTDNQSTATTFELGISIRKSHRNQGLGTVLLTAMEKLVTEYMPDIRIIQLTVFGNNERAQHLYKKMGYEEFGRLPEGIEYKDDFYDHVFMYKNIAKE